MGPPEFLLCIGIVVCQEYAAPLVLTPKALDIACIKERPPCFLVISRMFVLPEGSETGWVVPGTVYKPTFLAFAAA